MLFCRERWDGLPVPRGSQQKLGTRTKRETDVKGVYPFCRDYESKAYHCLEKHFSIKRSINQNPFLSS